MLGSELSKNADQVTEEEKAMEWVRFIKASLSQEYRLNVLAHLDKPMRLQVLKKLGAKVAEDVFVVTADE